MFKSIGSAVLEKISSQTLKTGFENNAAKLKYSYTYDLFPKLFVGSTSVGEYSQIYVYAKQKIDFLYNLLNAYNLHLHEIHISRSTYICM